MDLENELRQAMAEHVAGVSAPRTLAHEARRRHQRTVRRRTAIVVAAAGVVVAVAMVPTYQAIRPQPVGAPGPEGRQSGGGPRGGATATAQPSIPSGARPAATPKAAGGTSRTAPAPSRHPAAGTHGTISGVTRSLLGYLPPGIRPDGTCDTQNAGARRTTVCRWTGSAGWVEVRLMHDSALTSPADMGLTPPMPKHTQVHGHTALRGDGPATPSIMWIEHAGLGVWVGVSPGLGDSLLRVAEGVHAS